MTDTNAINKDVSSESEPQTSVDVQIVPADIKKQVESGACHFEVLKCEATKSQKGDPMLKTTIRVKDDKGGSSLAFEHFLLTPSSVWVLGNMCAASGNLEMYKSGKFKDTDLIGAKGQCVVEVEKNEGANADKYPHNFNIKSYIF